MKKSMLFLIAVVAVLSLSITACGGGAKKNAATEKPTFDSVVVDTTVSMTGDEDSPKCQVKLHILYAKGANAQLVNDSIIASGILSTDENADGNKNVGSQTIPQMVENFVAVYLKNYKEQCAEMLKEGFDDTSCNNEYIVSTSVIEGRNGGITYIIEGYSYTGGAHGLGFTETMNFDFAAGKELAYGDVFTEEGEILICDAIVEDVIRQYGVKNLNELKERGVFELGDVHIPDNFILGKDSVTFIFQPYEVAPYCEGEIRSTLAYSDLQGSMIE